MIKIKICCFDNKTEAWILKELIRYYFGREWISDHYLWKMKQRNDDTWRNSERYLYYSYKNKNFILPSILLFAFCSLGGLEGMLQYCFAYLPFVYFWCHSNNRALDRNTDVICKRITFMEMRIKRGEYTSHE